MSGGPNSGRPARRASSGSEVQSLRYVPLATAEISPRLRPISRSSPSERLYKARAMARSRPRCAQSAQRRRTLVPRPESQPASRRDNAPPGVTIVRMISLHRPHPGLCRVAARDRSSLSRRDRFALHILHALSAGICVKFLTSRALDECDRSLRPERQLSTGSRPRNASGPLLCDRWATA